MKISITDIDKHLKRLPAYANGSAASGAPSQQRILWMAMFVPGLEGRRGLPYVLVGEPGTVKTSIVKQLARKASLPFWSVLGSIRQPVDFMGCPVPQRMKLSESDQHLSPDGDENFLYMHYAPAGFGVQAALARNGVLLFDEANNMPLAVQSAMLRVLFEGVVGELELPPGIRMFLATNEIEDAAGGHEISRAMASRMGWLEWEGVSVDQFCSYLAASGGRGPQHIKIDPVDFREEERKVDALWNDAWGYASMLVTGFLKSRGDLFHNKPKDRRQREWPNARTWDFAAHALAGSFVYELGAVERAQAVGAYVGSAAYTELYAYAKDADLPDPAKLLDGQETFTHKPARLDRTAAVLSGCCAKVLSVNGNAPELHNQRVDAMWRLIDRLPDGALDVAMPHVRAMTVANLMINSQVGYRVLAKLDPVLDAGGV